MFSYQAKTKITMFKTNNKEEEFLNQLLKELPTRHQGKRGQTPIRKEILIREIYRLIKTNCGWRNIEHSSTCRNYIRECQRRGKIKSFFHLLTDRYKKFKCKKFIVDSSLLQSYNVPKGVSFSGKSHNYCTKLTLGINENYIPLEFNFAKGSKSESEQLNKMLTNMNKLPVEMYLDMGYENYERRRYLKSKNCQVRMQQAIRGKNRKRGPKFTFTKEQKEERKKIERFFGWIKSFKAIRYRTIRISALFHTFAIIVLSFIAFRSKF